MIGSYKGRNDVSVCARTAPPSCTGTFAGVPVYLSDVADVPSGLIGCFGRATQLSPGVWCPGELPVTFAPGVGDSGFGFWVAPGLAGPGLTANGITQCHQFTATR
jgi:hypothetical protein